MSERQEKRLRRDERLLYLRELRDWQRSVPPWWAFISRRRWRRARPVMPKCVIDRTEKGKEARL